VLEAVAGEEVEADPRGHATGSAPPLQSVGPRNPRVLQALHAFSGIVPENMNKRINVQFNVASITCRLKYDCAIGIVCGTTKRWYNSECLFSKMLIYTIYIYI